MCHVGVAAAARSTREFDNVVVLRAGGAVVRVLVVLTAVGGFRVGRLLAVARCGVGAGARGGATQVVRVYDNRGACSVPHIEASATTPDGVAAAVAAPATARRCSSVVDSGASCCCSWSSTNPAPSPKHV